MQLSYDYAKDRALMCLRANYESHLSIYRIMKGNGLVTPSAAKSRKRKWVRYERRHSNSMWHIPFGKNP